MKIFIIKLIFAISFFIEIFIFITKMTIFFI